MGADTTPQAFVRVYEAEKDQWQLMTSMPTPRYGATPFVIGNRIYMMGKLIQQHLLAVISLTYIMVGYQNIQETPKITFSVESGKES